MWNIDIDYLYARELRRTRQWCATVSDNVYCCKFCPKIELSKSEMAFKAWGSQHAAAHRVAFESLLNDSKQIECPICDEKIYCDLDCDCCISDLELVKHLHTFHSKELTEELSEYFENCELLKTTFEPLTTGGSTADLLQRTSYIVCKCGWSMPPFNTSAEFRSLRKTITQHLINHLQQKQNVFYSESKIISNILAILCNSWNGTQFYSVAVNSPSDIQEAESCYQSLLTELFGILSPLIIRMLHGISNPFSLQNTAKYLECSKGIVGSETPKRNLQRQNGAFDTSTLMSRPSRNPPGNVEDNEKTGSGEKLAAFSFPSNPTLAGIPNISTQKPTSSRYRVVRCARDECGGHTMNIWDKKSLTTHLYAHIQHDAARLKAHNAEFAVCICGFQAFTPTTFLIHTLLDHPYMKKCFLNYAGVCVVDGFKYIIRSELMSILNDKRLKTCLQNYYFWASWLCIAAADLNNDEVPAWGDSIEKLSKPWLKTWNEQCQAWKKYTSVITPTDRRIIFITPFNIHMVEEMFWDDFGYSPLDTCTKTWATLRRWYLSDVLDDKSIQWIPRLKAIVCPEKNLVPEDDDIAMPIVVTKDDAKQIGAQKRKMQIPEDSAAVSFTPRRKRILAAPLSLHGVREKSFNGGARSENPFYVDSVVARRVKMGAEEEELWTGSNGDDDEPGASAEMPKLTSMADVATEYVSGYTSVPSKQEKMFPGTSTQMVQAYTIESESEPSDCEVQPAEEDRMKGELAYLKNFSLVERTEILAECNARATCSSAFLRHLFKVPGFASSAYCGKIVQGIPVDEQVAAVLDLNIPFPNIAMPFKTKLRLALDVAVEEGNSSGSRDNESPQSGPQSESMKIDDGEQICEAVEDS